MNSEAIYQSGSRVSRDRRHGDPLTGASTRKELHRLINGALRRVDSLHPLLIVCLNLDNFTRVNEVLGDLTGDRLLAEITGRLGVFCEHPRLLGRMHADEFVMIVHPGVQEGAAAQILRRIACCFEHTFTIGNLSIAISSGIGGVLVRDKEFTSSDLLHLAREAMLLTKSGKKQSPYLMEEEMTRNLAKKARLAALIREAVDNNRIFLFYQPLLFLDHGGLAAAEALLRIACQDGRILKASDIFPYLEISLLDEFIDRWVIEEAIHELRQYPAQNLPEGFRILINVHGELLSRPDQATRWLQLIGRADLEPCRFAIEIPGSLARRDSSPLIANLEILREAGMEIILDHFGEDPIDLMGLRGFPVDAVKIRPPILEGVLPDHPMKPVLLSVLEISKILRFRIIASGVERREIHDCLRPLGFTRTQGNLNGSPAPLADILQSHSAGTDSPIPHPDTWLQPATD